MRRAVLALTVLLAGCSLKKMSINMTAKLMKAAAPAGEREADLELARAAIPGQLKQLEGLLESAPKHRALLEMAAGGFAQFSYGFVEDEVESLTGEGDAARRRATSARATQLYDRSFEYAMRLLETYDPTIRSAYRRGGQAWQTALANLPRESVAGLTWGGIALATAAGLNSHDPARLTRLPAAQAMLERAHAIDPKFAHAAAGAALGSLYAKQGQREKSRKSFDEAIATVGPGYFMPRVSMARDLLTEPGDRKERRQVLEAVLEARVTDYPENRLANEVARRRAARYLEATPR